MKRDREDTNTNTNQNNSRGGRAETRLSHPFKANFNDHFETSILALRDIYPFLDELRQLTRPSCPEAFTLYDPYYCTGKVKDTWKLSEFGIGRVIHENRDFYDDIKKGIAPPVIIRDEVENFIKDIGDSPAPFDVCVTNPPFSDNHIERFLIEFAIPSKKPWAMLVPDYIASKAWFTKIVDEHYDPAPVVGRNVGFDSKPNPAASRVPAGLALAASIPRMAIPMMPVAPMPTDEQAADESISSAAEVPKQPTPKLGQEPFYVVPKGRYEFEHPVQAGRERSHFKSLWIVSAGRRTNELLKSVKAKADPAKVSVANGRVELTRQSATPGTPGSAALIPNAPRNNLPAFKRNNAPAFKRNAPIYKKRD